MVRAFASIVLATALAASIASPAGAWGPTGHRITGQIAEDNISGHTRARIAQLLGNETLAEAATWPDEQRSNPLQFWQETATPWHFVTLPNGRPADQLEHPPEGDAATALEHFTQVLRDPAANNVDKALALRFVVHLIGDLHQPLHVGREGDRGGNDIRVTWFDTPQNLHWVWDEGLIQRQQLSFSEYAARLEGRITPENVIAWWNVRPVTWIAESATLRERIYPATGGKLGDGTAASPVRLFYQYAYDWTPPMEMRLEQAGIRIAAYLDWVFADEA